MRPLATRFSRNLNLNHRPRKQRVHTYVEYCDAHLHAAASGSSGATYAMSLGWLVGRSVGAGRCTRLISLSGGIDYAVKRITTLRARGCRERVVLSLYDSHCAAGPARTTSDCFAQWTVVIRNVDSYIRRDLRCDLISRARASERCNEL